jgi:hypothetical protein
VLVEADVDLTVPFRSILFERPGEAPPEKADRREDPAVFSDLNLDQVFAAMAVRWDEYDLMPLFRVPLHDVQSVEYRHQILQDMEGAALSAALAVPSGGPARAAALYSGREYALVEWGSWMKLFLLSSVFMNVFVIPWGLGSATSLPGARSNGSPMSSGRSSQAT